MALVWLAGFVGRRGIGNGFSVLIATIELPGVARSLVQSVDERLAAGDPVLAPLVFGGMLVAALAASTARWPTKGWDDRPPRPDLLMPASGILVVILAETLYHYQDRLPDSGVVGRVKAALEPGSLVDAVVYPSLLVAMGLLCVWLFNRPAAVAATWCRAPGFGGDGRPALAASRVAFRRGASRAALFVGAMAVMSWYEERTQVTVDIMWLTVFACIGADLVGEWRFHRRHSNPVAVWPLHQTYTVGPALHALAAAGIPCFARALRHGALLSFWGPYVPVEIVVPRASARDARDLLRTLLQDATVRQS